MTKTHPFNLLASYAACALVSLSACGDAALERPNVLFVVWDTTRADHLSLYGYEHSTTPFLEEWSEKALVFEDCISTGSSTVPAHGAMFTGLLPAEHGANNLHAYLDERHETLAELFSAGGYDTYCFAANPHISAGENFTQGFDVVEHPWDRQNFTAALELIESKLQAEDRSSELPDKIRSRDLQTWDVKACGALANVRLVEWLEARDPSRPFYAFLNFMEAHRPFITARAYRERFMTEAQVELSYSIDRSWDTMWSYTFGLHEYSPEELEVMALTYDACIAELDDLFRDLIEKLEAAGQLENTVVVLTGDHGEHLGEHHMLDHQYSLYEGLVHVPLVLSYPPKVAPGRLAAPVSNYDVFPTLLELAGLDAPEDLDSKAVSLLAPSAQRVRMSDYPSDFEFPLRSVSKLHPDWDPSAFRRRLTAIYSGNSKLIWSSNGQHELFDRSSDPDETNNLYDEDNPTARELMQLLRGALDSMTPFDYEGAGIPELSDEMRERLQALGYFDSEGDE